MEKDTQYVREKKKLTAEQVIAGSTGYESKQYKDNNKKTEEENKEKKTGNRSPPAEPLGRRFTGCSRPLQGDCATTIGLVFIIIIFVGDDFNGGRPRTGRSAGLFDYFWCRERSQPGVGRRGNSDGLCLDDGFRFGFILSFGDDKWRKFFVL